MLYRMQYMVFEDKDPQTTWLLVSCFYWALEPESEILMFMWCLAAIADMEPERWSFKEASGLYRATS